MSDEPKRQPCAVCGKPGTARLCGVHGMEFLTNPLTQMVLPGASEAEMEMAFAAYLLLKTRRGARNV